MTKPTVCLVMASGQNVFFAELLEALEAALENHGLPVERAVDHFPTWRPGYVYVFVPHEYMPLVMDEAHPDQQQLRHSVVLCTEQPGTSWFEEAVHIAARAGGVVDINQLGVAELRRRGINAQLLQLGYVPAWDHWRGEPGSLRPIDAAFLGGYTPRRAALLARCAQQLNGYRSELRFTETAAPHSADSTQFISGQAKWQFLRSTKVLINVHRGSLGYLEWQRVVEAMLNGCVVLTEHSLGYEPLVAGEHFVSASYRNLPLVLSRLLQDTDQLEAVRAAAYKFLCEQLPLSRGIDVLVRAIMEVDRLEDPTSEVSVSSGPRPRQLESPVTEFERISQTRTELDVIRMGLKEVVLSQRQLSRSVSDLRDELRGTSEDQVELYGPRRSEPPRVSVILTVYNYAEFVSRAVASVALSHFADYEIVVIDDASTDDSPQEIRQALNSRPWVDASVVSRARNRGLPAARNLGVEYARGEFVFILDADNLVYPHALTRLVEALEKDPEAKFAYGIIEQFRVSGSTGLMSWRDWDPAALRYGNFVDAMTLVRRAALIESGGYSTETQIFGWEDFALWCEFADRGWRGVSVKEILTRYRVGLHSMISLTNIDGSVAWAYLVERYGWLAGRGFSPIVVDRAAASP